MRQVTFPLLILLTLLTTTLPALAGDDGLYEAEPPADAAFFRVFNASDRTPVEVRIEGTTTTVDPLSASDYGFSEKRSPSLMFNGTSTQVATKAGDVITLIWDGEQAKVIQEEPFADKRKARIKLFNIGAPNANLKTEDGATTVIETVADHQYGFRDINALSLPFSIYEGERQLLTTDRIDLKKGMTTSVFLVQNGTTPIYVVSEQNR
jgi:alginate O-acetyltransferase complex protein AlgF